MSGVVCHVYSLVGFRNGNGITTLDDTVRGSGPEIVLHRKLDAGQAEQDRDCRSPSADIARLANCRDVLHDILEDHRNGLGLCHAHGYSIRVETTMGLQKDMIFSHSCIEAMIKPV